MEENNLAACNKSVRELAGQSFFQACQKAIIQQPAIGTLNVFKPSLNIPDSLVNMVSFERSFSDMDDITPWAFQVLTHQKIFRFRLTNRL